MGLSHSLTLAAIAKIALGCFANTLETTLNPTSCVIGTAGGGMRVLSKEAGILFSNIGLSTELEAALVSKLFGDGNKIAKPQKS